ncbi:cytochrome b-c1 complex subunit 6, mitochondrial-like [Oscarella lobularis]|uniref:cytochrome b-c1 complex subunit 6, mitochondrial-like n=1 Tax=Oscarella lobularis TaxID=121494 RepID=UPI00331429FE
MADDDDTKTLEAATSESIESEADEAPVEDSSESGEGEENEEAGGGEEEDEEEDEEELEDPQETLREKCGESRACAALKEELNRCTERVESRTKTEEKCEQELFDFIHCIDQCASRSLFSKLK